LAIGQIPLRLAWAITIHKIQGATLPMADIDIGNTIFECGQSYVALSRVENLEGLYLSGFRPDKIKVHPGVKEFYKKIPQIEYEEEEEEEYKMTVEKETKELSFEEYTFNPTDIKTIFI
jgi:ATP-dependent exoDNAse (exonuclease V) alpha subunit